MPVTDPPRYMLIQELVREKVAVILQDHAGAVPSEARASIAWQISHDVCDDVKTVDPARGNPGTED